MSMDILGIIALYIFGVVIMVCGAFWHFRDCSKKTKIIVLIVNLLVIHIIILFDTISRLNR